MILASETADQAEFLGRSTWRKSRAVAEIHSMANNLPHLPDVLCAFLTGALSTWIRFCEEFEVGGDIDSFTAAERESAWMPGTNDINEGTLGTVVRINRRNKPTQTMHQNVAQAMFSRNETQAFIDENFIDEDHTFVMQETRRRDKDQLESKRLEQIRIHEERVVTEKRMAAQKRLQAAADSAAKVAATNFKLIDSSSHLEAMKCAELDEQLAILKQWDLSLRAPSYYKPKSVKLATAIAAFERYEARGRTQVIGGTVGT